MIVGDGGGAIVLFLSGCCQCNRHDLERNSMEFPQQAEIGHTLVECLEHIPLMGLWTFQLWVQWNQFPTPVSAQGGEKKGLSDLEQQGAGRISEFEISSTTSERSCWWKMFAGYVYMYTLSQYWLPQCILDVVSSVFSVVLNWGEHWVYALACSLLHVRWLPLESDDQKSSARWCKVCSYALPFFCTSLNVRCVRAIGNCCHWKSLQDYSSFDPPLWCFWWALLPLQLPGFWTPRPGPATDKMNSTWAPNSQRRRCHVLRCMRRGFMGVQFHCGNTRYSTGILHTKNRKPCQNILEIFWDTALIYIDDPKSCSHGHAIAHSGENEALLTSWYCLRKGVQSRCGLGVEVRLKAGTCQVCLSLWREDGAREETLGQVSVVFFPKELPVGFKDVVRWPQ